MVGAMRLLAATIACLVALATGAAAVAAAPAPTYAFTLLYERSGGFAPSTDRLEVAPGRSAVAESSGTRAGNRRVQFRISNRRIRALERSLRRAHFGSLENPGPSGCADCFVYSIFYRGHQLELDESQMPRQLGAAVAEIEAIISAHTIPPNA
jgi:hypothetical protein